MGNLDTMTLIVTVTIVVNVILTIIVKVSQDVRTIVLVFNVFRVGTRIALLFAPINP